MSFDPQLLEQILVCTRCRSHLVRDTDALVCVTPDCRMRYAIHHEIPNMLVEEAVAVPLVEWGPVMQRAGRDPVTGLQPAS